MIPMNYARRFKTISPEIKRAQRLGHRIVGLDVRNGHGLIVATGECEDCGGSLVIERDRASREADALRVTGDLLTMECA